MNEDRRAEVLRRSHQLLERGDEIIEAPRPQSREWRLPELETVPEARALLTDAEASRLARRVSDHDALFKNCSDALGPLADKAGAVTGELGRAVKELRATCDAIRAECKAEIQSLRGELVLLRAQGNARPQKSVNRSRAPFNVDGDVSLRN
jgi:hypothetical protein